MNVSRKLSSLVIVVATLPLFLAATLLPGAGRTFDRWYLSECRSLVS